MALRVGFEQGLAGVRSGGGAGGREKGCCGRVRGSKARTSRSSAAAKLATKTLTFMGSEPPFIVREYNSVSQSLSVPLNQNKLQNTNKLTGVSSQARSPQRHANGQNQPAREALRAADLVRGCVPTPILI